MITIVFATNNAHKVSEIKAICGEDYNIISLKDAGIDIDIPESYDSLRENATAKSKTIYNLTHNNCFSEDTGLEVDALKGAPGVKSARYADGDTRFENNIDKLLFEMSGKENRAARFRTVISLIIDGTEHFFEGTCEGNIVNGRRGTGGFGYDPVFIPAGSSRTFGEMDLSEKSKFSHRRKATDQLLLFLSRNGKNSSLL